MEKKFECPELIIVLFAEEDIIVTSTFDPLTDNGEFEQE